MGRAVVALGRLRGNLPLSRHDERGALTHAPLPFASAQLCERGLKVDSYKYCYPQERPNVRL